MTRCDKFLARLERRKSAVLADLSKWSETDLHFRPTLESWSALDVLEHVMKTERGVASVLQKQLHTPRKLPLSDKIRGFLLIRYVYAPTRVKVPQAAAATLPGSSPGLETASVAWQETRAMLAEIIEQGKDAHTKHAIFRHPVSGWMTLPRTLHFLDAHLAHHQHQWRRLRQDA